MFLNPDGVRSRSLVGEHWSCRPLCACSTPAVSKLGHSRRDWIGHYVSTRTFEIWGSRLFWLIHSEPPESALNHSFSTYPPHLWSKDRREAGRFPRLVRSCWRACAHQGLELWQWAFLSLSFSLSLLEGWTHRTRGTCSITQAVPSSSRSLSDRLPWAFAIIPSLEFRGPFPWIFQLARNFSFESFKIVFIDFWKREEYWLLVPLLYAFIGWHLYMPWPGIEPSTLVYWDNSLTNWATQ